MKNKIKICLVKNGYPPHYTPEVFREVMDQVENFKENETVGIRKLENIEDDRDVRNLIYQRIQMDATTSEDDLRREVIEQYGMRYPDMSLNDWRHIIDAYIPMIKKSAEGTIRAKEIRMEQYSMAAEEPEMEE